MTQFTDADHDAANREIWRRMNQTPTEWKLEEIEKLYPEHSTEGFPTEPRARLKAIKAARWTRVEPRGCYRKQCDGTERRVCRLLQYLEECCSCGARIGDNMN